jgi:hypothetical protein
MLMESNKSVRKYDIKNRLTVSERGLLEMKFFIALT